MARVCSLSGKKVLYGNNVSHANNKTRRRFLPNLQNVSFLSDILGLKMQLKLSTNAIRTIEKNGGLDNFLLKKSGANLSPQLQKLKKLICEKTAISV